MIRGIGIDLLAVERFAALEDKEGFSRNVFTPAENGLIENSTDHDRSGALLFTLKEAVLKALGCGLGQGSFWRNIKTGRDASVTTSGPLEAVAAAKAVSSIHNSAAHTARHALSVVLLESDD
jgi:holo-[acyl-carrier protein] synthase